MSAGANTDQTAGADKDKFGQGEVQHQDTAKARLRIDSRSPIELSDFKKAIAVERRAYYADFQGKHSTFSYFMRSASARLSSQYPHDPIWPTMRGLFRQYAHLDVGTRIAIIKRAEELLDALTDSLSAASGMKNSMKDRLSRDSTPSKSGDANAKEKQPVAGKHDNFDDIEEIPVQFVRGVGPKVVQVLNRLDIFTVGDLLRHYPRRHLDFKNRLYIRDLKPGIEVSILGTIRSVGAFQARRGNMSVLTITINDSTGSIVSTRFIGGQSNKYLLERYKQQFPKGAQVLASGMVDRDRHANRLCLRNAEIEILGSGEDSVGIGNAIDDDNSVHLHAGRLVPVYPLTEGISLRHLRSIIHNALKSYKHLIDDPLPESICKERDLLPRDMAIEQIHFPDEIEDYESARRRLVFDELLAIQIMLAQRRYKFESQESALSLKSSEDGLVARLVKSLPFTLTGAQMRVFNDTARDLAAAKPMHRLIQGDVGSGKTIVALMAFMVAIENGYQGVMMAPTEILAEQHFRQFQKLITALGLKACLVLGKQGQKERRLVQQEILSGQVHIAVGTHALLEDEIEFANLGLIIIDEQHRFGVKQRARLKAKSQAPELLTMTATPIPRTLALTLHGDLDVSEIDEMPPGRKPVLTELHRPAQKKQLFNRIREQILLGRQAYIVFPLIEESESLSAKAATAEYEKLRVGEFAQQKVGLMHGKLKPQEKEEVMEKFRNREFDILVCTTVIEVGVDVANATVMLIENADRFGLAQLHQLRGRVGRGADQSYCFLVSDSQAPSTRDRLQILCETNDGFVVAEKDLEIRGPGEFLGYKQSGLPDLVLTDLVKDAKVLEEARQTAIALIKQDPELQRHPALQKLLVRKSKNIESEIIQSG